MAEGRDSKGHFLPGAAHPRMGGRNKSPRRIEGLLQRIGQEELVHQGEKITKLEAVMRAVFGYALKGQAWAVQFIAERTEGKVRETVEVDVVAGPIRLLDFDGDTTAEALPEADPQDEQDA